MYAISNLFSWWLNLVNVFAQFLSWFTEPLPYLNISPLEIFSFNGLVLIIGLLLLRLVIGG